MSSGKIENQLLDAIQTVVNSTVEKAGYNKTIQATIVKCANEATGKYVLKYQDSLVYAYASDPDTKYSKGADVYVLIPNNDTGLNKTIIGSVSNLGSDYVTLSNEETLYDEVGKNCINLDTEFGLCSYTTGGSTTVLYDKTNNINLVGLKPGEVSMYIKNSDYLTCGASFKTVLNQEQQYNGDFGIAFELVFKNDADEEDVTRTYIVNTNKMVGNPYQLLTPIKQTETYEINGRNFSYVNKIYIYEKNFPNVATGRPNDIFVSSIILNGATLAETDTLSDCTLSLITKKGIYFDDTHLSSDTLTIEAQTRAKGAVIDKNSDLLKYYWFKENNSITFSSNKYCRYGGAGWECLNDSTTIDEVGIEWHNGNPIFTISKSDLLQKITEYKCVVVYNKDTVLTKKVSIYNNSSIYNITIESNEGTQFFYDIGTPELTCYVNGVEQTGSSYTYNWSVTDSYNNFSILTSENSKVQINVKDIYGYSTYKCSVSYNGNKIGTGTIVIKNSLEGSNVYPLIVDNGDQVFKYNTNGVSPASKSLENPIEILPISFTMFDENGNEVPHEAIGNQNVEWIIPTKDTMISIPSSYGEPAETDDVNHTATYKGYYELGFTIDNKYDIKKTNNIVQLRVNYKDKTLRNESSFTFLKEGESGTNGTEFACKIVPNINTGIAPTDVIVNYNNSTQQYELNYTPVNASKWFKVQLWHDGEKVFEGVSSGTSSEESDNQVDIKWEVLQNNYDGTHKDTSNLTINESTGAITLNATNYHEAEGYSDPVNIIKCSINYKGLIYYATIPVTIATVNNNYKISFGDENHGFNHVLYTADGKSPAYDNNNPFEIIVKKLVSGEYENISLSDNVTYEWSNCGQVYISGWTEEENLIIRNISRDKNQKYYKPIDTFNGLCLSNAVYCVIKENNQIIAKVHIPVHFYLNKFGNSAMNGWDGNRIEIKEDEGYILSPQVGAGHKEEDNSFTGVFIGDVLEAGSDKIETGLFGYNSGERTITLDSETGSAKFGKTGQGQIVIEPGSQTAVIRSGDYVAPVLNEDGDIVTPGKGFEIDLNDPHLTFGSGKFRVDKDGNVYAAGFATVAQIQSGKISVPKTAVTGLDTIENKVNDLDDSISYMEVFLPTSMVQFNTNTQLIPDANKTITLAFKPTWKGKQIAATASLKSATVAGITVSTVAATATANGSIAFTVQKDVAIANAVNDFTFEFACANGKTEKKVNVILAVQGKDGETGEQGPVGPAGKDGNSVTVKGTYSTLDQLIAEVEAGAITPTIGDGYIIGNDLYVYTNGGEGSGTLAEDWSDVGQFKGEDAKRCFIVASTEVFKSTDGTTYNPSNIVITPYLQAVKFSSWAYSTDGGNNFTTISSPYPNGITVDDETKKLTIANNSTLFNTNTALVFKCNSDNAETYDTITILKIKDGNDGNGISSIDYYYKATSTQTQPAAADITGTTIPTLSDTNKYLWQKEIISYTNGTNKTTISLLGSYGTKGDTGRGISSTTVTYKVLDTGTGNPGSTGWSAAVPSVENGKYLWTKTYTTYSDGQNPTTSYSVSYKGTNGISTTILSKSIEYAEGTNGITPPQTESDWGSEIPAVTDGNYLWTRTIVRYTNDGTTKCDETISYSASYQSKDGESAVQYYTHVMYAEDASGTNISSNPTGKTYMGVRVDMTETASTDPSKYTWVKFVGDDGDDATQYYTFIKYSANADGSGMVDTPTSSTKYVGTYVGTSNNPGYTSYKWSKYVGDNGTSATNIVCGNESQTFSCDKDGKVIAATTITIPFAGYVGASRKACTVAYSTLPSGVTLTSNTAATTSADGSLVFTVAEEATLGGATNGEITLTFTCNSKTFIKKFSWSKSITGATGAQGEKGNNGSNGSDGISVVSLDKYYGVSTSSSIEPSKYYTNIQMLPDEYQQVEYIESNGNGTGTGQYIDTEYFITLNKKFEWKLVIMPLVNQSGEREILANYGGGYNFQLGTSGLSWLSLIKTSCVVYPSINEVRLNEITTIKSKNPITPRATTTRSLYLFGQNEGNHKWGSSVRLYSCILYEDGVVVRNYIPCYRIEDNEIGLYDIVNNEFKQNLGLGSFTKGADVEDVKLDEDNQYLWSYDVITYTSGNKTETTHLVVGSCGDTGNGIQSIKEYYAVSSSNTTAPTTFSEDIPTMTPTNKYLWNYEVITYTNGTEKDTGKKVIGVYGNEGQDAIVFSVYAPNGTIFINQEGTLTLATQAYKGADAITSGATYKWEKYVSGSWVQKGTSATLSVNGSEVQNVATYRGTMTYNSKTYTDIITLEDKTDSVVASITSTGGNVFKEGQGNTILTCSLFANGIEIDELLTENISDTVPSSPTTNMLWYKIDKTARTVTLKKYNGSSWVDATETQNYTYNWYRIDYNGNPLDDGSVFKTGKVIYVDDTEVNNKTTFTCEIQ